MKPNLSLAVMFFFLVPHSMYSFAPTNFLRPDDPLLRRPYVCNNLSFGLTFETGDIGSCSGTCNFEANILNKCHCTQSVLSMLQNSVCLAKDEGAQTILNQFTTGLGGPITDDGRRGHVEMAAGFRQTNVQLYGYGTITIPKVPGCFSLGFHVPFVSKSVRDFKYYDLTEGLFITDLLLKNFIKNLQDQTLKYGCLTLNNWSDSGLGDVLLLCDWMASFAHDTQIMQRYSVFAKIGVSFATSREKNENCALSMPLGNDGAMGIPFGMAFTAECISYLRMGVAADLLYLFKTTRVRRLKTDVAQTDLLLLNKGLATKRFGLTWQFETFLEAFNFFRGLSFKITYQYVQHQNDRLSTCDCNFDNHIINTACNLAQWHAHNIVFGAQYDFDREFEPRNIKAHVGLFYKLPFATCRVIDPQTFGGYVGIAF